MNKRINPPPLVNVMTVKAFPNFFIPAPRFPLALQAKIQQIRTFSLRKSTKKVTYHQHLCADLDVESCEYFQDLSTSLFQSAEYPAKLPPKKNSYFPRKSLENLIIYTYRDGRCFAQSKLWSFITWTSWRTQRMSNFPYYSWLGSRHCLCIGYNRFRWNFFD